MDSPARGEPGCGVAGEDAAEELAIIEPLCAVFRRRLKAEGLKYTPERAQILDAIIQMEEVFEADALLERMKRAGFRVSKATIYRTIRLLADAGIIQQVLLDGDQAHYQLAYGTRSGGILVNVDTNEITPIDVPELAAIRDRLCARHGLKPEGHRLVVYGRGA
jgi:Fur family ferric uptake transcriptional regulator